MDRMKLTEKEKEQILKSGVEAMTKIIERLEEENKKLKEIMCDVLYRVTRHNIKNVVYKGKEIEIGNGDYDYTLD